MPADTAENEHAATAGNPDIGPGPHDDALDGAVEALLFSVDRPTPPRRLAEAIFEAGVVAEVEVDDAMVSESVARLNETYERTGRAFCIEEVAGGLRVMTRAEHAGVLAAFHRGRAGSKLSRPALETLAIIAYKQPITRARLEAIRGVACGEVSLLERRLIEVAGRAEELGRPMLYGTTRRFLDAFGLARLKDLPNAAELLGPAPGSSEGASGGVGGFRVEPEREAVRTDDDGGGPSEGGAGDAEN